MKRQASSTGEQRQNCFPMDLFLSGKKHALDLRLHVFSWNGEIKIWRTDTNVCLIRICAFMGKCHRSHHAVQDARRPILLTTCVLNLSMRVVNVIRMHVKSRDEREWNVRGGEKEKKQNRRNCRHFRYLQALWFACAFFSHYLNKRGAEKEEGTEVLIKIKDCNSSFLLIL